MVHALSEKNSAVVENPDTIVGEGFWRTQFPAAFEGLTSTEKTVLEKAIHNEYLEGFVLPEGSVLKIAQRIKEIRER